MDLQEKGLKLDPIGNLETRFLKARDIPPVRLMTEVLEIGEGFFA